MTDIWIILYNIKRIRNTERATQNLKKIIWLYIFYFMSIRLCSLMHFMKFCREKNISVTNCRKLRCSNLYFPFHTTNIQILSCSFYEKGDTFQTQLLSQDIFHFHAMPAKFNSHLRLWQFVGFYFQYRPNEWLKYVTAIKLI